MQVDFTQELKKLEGGTLYKTEIRVVDGVAKNEDTSESMLLRTPCINALMGVYEDEKNLSGEDKVKRYDMAIKIQSMSKVDFTPEDLSLIRKLVAKAYSPLIVGQVWKLLDIPPKEEPKKK